jgi:hypothetical protein
MSKQKTGHSCLTIANILSNVPIISDRFLTVTDFSFSTLHGTVLVPSPVHTHPTKQILLKLAYHARVPG